MQVTTAFDLTRQAVRVQVPFTYTALGQPLFMPRPVSNDIKVWNPSFVAFVALRAKAIAEIPTECRLVKCR
jgi:hypothetical protein